MKRILIPFCALLLIASSSLSAGLKVKTGSEAPGFTLKNLNGVEVSLSDYQGKMVVLEWTRPSCPFVKKFYESGKMQEFQKKAADDGVVWLTINSTNPDSGTYLNESESKEYVAEKGVNSLWLLDGSGEVGKMYGAARTPHCYVIDKEGKLIYQGAIDSERTADPEDIEGATNFVFAALEASAKGMAPEKPEVIPYGCSIKY